MLRLSAALFAFTFVAVLPSSALLADPATPAKAPTIVPVIELSGELVEAGKKDDPILGAVGNDSLRRLTNRLKAAGNDDQVAAVILLLNNFSGSSAQFEELHKALLELREKKPVYAHADSVTTKTYSLLTAAKRISVSPTGDVWVNGLSMEGIYVRGLLDMLGVQPDFLTCGPYKSAAEMFTQKQSSPEALEMQNWLLDSLYNALVERIAEGRNVDQATVKTWIDHGLYSAERALEAKLIDGVESREALLEVVKSEHGAAVQLKRNYGKKTASDIDLENPFAVLQLWAKILSGSKETRSNRNSIAIVHINGPIMLGKSEASLFGGSNGAYSESIRKVLVKIADEPRIRAVVLRIDSPGGSATASEIMLQAIQHVKKSKPVIVSMGGTAASGGYYVACDSNRIFADASTITGSIGVVGGKLATDALWQRVGVNFSQNTRGAKAGIMTSSKPWSTDEKKEIQNWMDEVYGVFKSHVVAGRGDKLKKPIDELAGGRVYTGQQALEFGLVDEIGTLENALQYAAKEVDLTDYEVREFPEQQNFFEQLLADVNESKKGDEKHLSAELLPMIGPALNVLDPQRAALVRSMIRQLDGFKSEKVLLTAPLFHIAN